MGRFQRACPVEHRSPRDACGRLLVHGVDQYSVVIKGEKTTSLVAMGEESTGDRVPNDERHDGVPARRAVA